MTAPIPSISNPSPSGATPSGSSTIGDVRSTAADQLAGFFAAATRADGQLRRAAAEINRGIGPTTIRFDQRTVAAVRAIDLDAVVRAMPGGLPPALQRSLLQVYADLASRTAAMHDIELYAGQPLPRNGEGARTLFACLGNGSAPAGLFGSDLAAARRLAARTGPVSLARASSRSSAEIAIRTWLIHDRNYAGGGCGGYIPRPIVLEPITWKRIVLTGAGVWDGTIGELPFRAQYTGQHGWRVVFAAN
ncbi:MAG TPA: hypothetical protein VFP72_14705 [Kineosporiaceae bacterium]|nr:hypothetical protein [Kineosporiaceae bacterium]